MLNKSNSKNILIEIILTNKCNKRCEYCDLDFKDKSQSFYSLDSLINFLYLNPANYTINFFWWEPLLYFNKVKYFIDNSKDIVSNFTIWTNWNLLTKDILEYFKLNNVKIYLSIDNISLFKWLNIDLISSFKDIIIINFINDPDYLFNSINLFNNIKSYNFTDISFMPVFYSKKWSKDSIYNLRLIYRHLKENSNWINITYYWYFNWVSNDIQFIYDTDSFFYSDLDSLLWIQKQYKKMSFWLKNDIYSATKLLKLYKNTNINLNDLVLLYDIKNILNLVFKIPKDSWDLIYYKVIDKIFTHGW